MQALSLAGILLLATSVLAQEVEAPILISHDRIDGPYGGMSHVVDLQVFSNGRVLYVEEQTESLGQKPTRTSRDGHLEEEQVKQVAKLLDSSGVRNLKSKIPSMRKPIDFFWLKSLEIKHADRDQKIEIENFYPFPNLRCTAYPRALIELECTLQDIAAKSTGRQNDEDWCKELVRQVETDRSTPKECGLSW